MSRGAVRVAVFAVVLVALALPRIESVITANPAIGIIVLSGILGAIVLTRLLRGRA